MSDSYQIFKTSDFMCDFDELEQKAKALKITDEDKKSLEKLETELETLSE